MSNHSHAMPSLRILARDQRGRMIVVDVVLRGDELPVTIKVYASPVGGTSIPAACFFLSHHQWLLLCACDECVHTETHDAKSLPLHINPRFPWVPAGTQVVLSSDYRKATMTIAIGDDRVVFPVPTHSMPVRHH